MGGLLLTLLGLFSEGKRKLPMTLKISQQPPTQMMKTTIININATIGIAM